MLKDNLSIFILQVVHPFIDQMSNHCVLLNNLVRIFEHKPTNALSIYVFKVPGKVEDLQVNVFQIEVFLRSHLIFEKLFFLVQFDQLENQLCERIFNPFIELINLSYNLLWLIHESAQEQFFVVFPT